MKTVYLMSMMLSLFLAPGCTDDSDAKARSDAGEDARSQQDVAADKDSASPKDAASPDAVSPGDTTSDIAPNGGDTDVEADTESPSPSGSGAVIDGCQIFPDDNPWNQDISELPLHPRGAQILAEMNPSKKLHADWGNWSTQRYGIPWSSGTGVTPAPITWTAPWGESESDPMPCQGGEFCYPIPTDARIEGGPGADANADRHVLYLDTAGAPDNCTLYEIANAQNNSGGPWVAGTGAIFDLGSNALRPLRWTSADAAGLPILPGLVRVQEVLDGEIKHAMRFTVRRTAKAFILPATHAAGHDGVDLPPMGLRVRLRADFPVESVPEHAQVLLRAMQTYGLILADNGSDWFITGDSDDRWDPLMDDIISGLRQVRGSDFELVDTGEALPQ